MTFFCSWFAIRKNVTHFLLPRLGNHFFLLLNNKIQTGLGREPCHLEMPRLLHHNNADDAMHRCRKIETITGFCERETVSDCHHFRYQRKSESKTSQGHSLTHIHLATKVLRFCVRSIPAKLQTSDATLAQIVFLFSIGMCLGRRRLNFNWHNSEPVRIRKAPNGVRRKGCQLSLKKSAGGFGQIKISKVLRFDYSHTSFEFSQQQVRNQFQDKSAKITPLCIYFPKGSNHPVATSVTSTVLQSSIETKITLYDFPHLLAQPSTVRKYISPFYTPASPQSPTTLREARVCLNMDILHQ